MKTLCQQCVKIWAQSHLGMSICVFLYVYICIFVYLWICILWQCSANTTRCARTRRGIIVTEDWVVTQTPEMEMQDGKWKVWNLRKRNEQFGWKSQMGVIDDHIFLLEIDILLLVLQPHLVWVGEFSYDQSSPEIWGPHPNENLTENCSEQNPTSRCGLAVVGKGAGGGGDLDAPPVYNMRYMPRNSHHQEMCYLCS